jgi:UDP-galactopyranose mutase
VFVAVPHISVEGATQVTPDQPAGVGMDEAMVNAIQHKLLDELIATQGIKDFALWYYTPMALPFSRHLKPQAVIYDCMDELSHFQGAPPALLRREAELFKKADVVFTGGHSLYEAKREKHRNVHPCPSSVDVAHYKHARERLPDPADQAGIAHPRMGYVGVIDERMNLELIAGIARARPDWQIVMIGPVVKISQDSLPRAANLHYLGGKKYTELPSYISSWDVALMPFALNDATRFISPTKTPEYLAAGKPVVSTSIRDVVRPYGEKKLVHIADDVDGFVKAIEASLATDRAEWLPRVDAFLANTSWNNTWGFMKSKVDAAVAANAAGSRTLDAAV